MADVPLDFRNRRWHMIAPVDDRLKHMIDGLVGIVGGFWQAYPPQCPSGIGYKFVTAGVEHREQPHFRILIALQHHLRRVGELLDEVVVLPFHRHHLAPLHPRIAHAAAECLAEYRAVGFPKGVRPRYLTWVNLMLRRPNQLTSGGMVSPAVGGIDAEAVCLAGFQRSPEFSYNVRLADRITGESWDMIHVFSVLMSLRYA